MKDKFQILRDFANSNNKPDKNIYQFIKEVLDMNSAYAKENIKYKNQQKEFIKYLKDEEDRLERECSHIYEDSLGHTRLVNEDKFDEANNILQKYKSIIGDDK